MVANALIAQLERSLSSGSDAQRLEMLSRITDLFLADANRFTPAQINLFDELLTRFVSVIESDARARLAGRLAGVSNAPAGVIRTLAFDDDIEVARPVLRDSDQIEDGDLVVNANTKSQQHLLAISERKKLSEAVTDVLVTRGNPQVAQSVARNPNAQISFAGFGALVRRANGDDDLATAMGSRADMPRQHMLRLLDAASAKVRARLNEQAAPAGREAPSREAAGGAVGEVSQAAWDYSAARPKVESMHRAETLDEASIARFARERRLEELVVGLSLLCEVNTDVVERALTSPSAEVILILLKIAGFSWATAKAVLMLKAGGMAPHDIDQALANFSRLNVGTARKVLGFYNIRTEGFTAAAS